MAFWLILLSLIVLDVMWWRWADERLGPLARGGVWRVFLAVFMVLQIFGFLLVVYSRATWSRLPIHAWILGAVFIWHVLVAPATMALLAGGGGVAGVARIFGGVWRFFFPGRVGVGSGLTSDLSVEGSAGNDSVGDGVGGGRGATRRQVLAGIGAAVSPVLAVGGTGIAMAHLNDFRVRRMTIEVEDLPTVLEGLTIVHISDVHTGAFTPQAKLAAIVERTNALDADIVAMAGDLIDYTLADLPAGLEMLRRLKSRHGLYVCEGNHDLFEDREEFEDRLLGAGIGLLLDEGRTVVVKGQPVQVLGLGYGGERQRAALIESHMQRVLSRRREDAFQVLLAHHPHAFDAAAGAGIPLTLSGHTHGGQLMLNDAVGAGPLLFRYWSGLYRQGRSSLVVSNGVGNWFPLRVNAPPEIGHLMLRRGRRDRTGGGAFAADG